MDSLLMEYLDGSLPPEQRAAVQKLIESDPEATARLNEYQNLDNLFRTQPPLPNIHWDMLAARISASIARHTPIA
ncbi:MAG TPA: hypothetical protein VGG44_10255 [Tepidisphaeraceae bacterium]